MSDILGETPKQIPHFDKPPPPIDDSNIFIPDPLDLSDNEEINIQSNERISETDNRYERLEEELSNENPDVNNIISICTNIGFIPKDYRKEVWKLILLPSDCDSFSLDTIGSLINNEEISNGIIERLKAYDISII